MTELTKYAYRSPSGNFLLNSISFENFKIFKNKTEFEIAPITIFTGPNNSGKSTVIDSFNLLISASKKDLLGNLDLAKTSSKFNSFRSIRNNNSRKKIISIWLNNYQINYTRRYNISTTLVVDSISLCSKNNKPILRIGEIFEHGEEDVYGVYINWHELFHERIKGKPNIDYSTETLETISNAIADKDEWLYGLSGSRGGNQEIKESIFLISRINELIEKGEKALKYPYKGIYRALNSDKIHEIEKIRDLLFDEMIEIHRDLRDFVYFFDTISEDYFIFPAFRGVPQSFYNPYNQRDFISNYYHDLINEFNDDIIVDGWTDELSDSQKRINEYLKLFGFGDAFIYEYDEKNLNTSLKIANGKKKTTINNLGYGVSQVLPLIIECSRGKYRNIIIEEPESHLHPNLQSKLADLFVDALDNATTDGMSPLRNIMIETHSEYFIKKLQYLVAKRKISKERILIYYFNNSSNSRNNEGPFKKIQINDDGSLTDNFGPGFFDESINLEFDLLKLKNSNKN